jgi:probable 2-oxoglutarate dehydrogenase E1 component DHKTD1
LYNRYEELKHAPIPAEERRRLAVEMLRSQTYDNFLATKFSNVKRYGGEGAEAMMGFFTELFRRPAEDGLSDIVLGMAHRHAPYLPFPS